MNNKTLNTQDSNTQSQRFFHPINTLTQKYNDIKNSKYLDRKTKKYLLKQTKKEIKRVRNMDF